MKLHSNPMDAALTAAWGNHIHSFLWDHWVTLTSRFNAGPIVLATEFRNGYIRRLGWHAKQPITWYATFERSPAGIFHIHALIAGTDELTCATVAGAWKLGRTDVDKYDGARAASWYMSKTVHLADEYWPRAEMSRREPPRRSKEPGPRAA
jgi:hypothetical protein